jgi:hypothetical protein
MMTTLRFLLCVLFAAASANATTINGALFLRPGVCALTSTQDLSASAPKYTQQFKMQQPLARNPAAKMDKRVIPDFAEVTPTLYRGAQPRKHGFETLARMGIRIVVDRL